MSPILLGFWKGYLVDGILWFHNFYSMSRQNFLVISLVLAKGWNSNKSVKTNKSKITQTKYLRLFRSFVGLSLFHFYILKIQLEKDNIASSKSYQTKLNHPKAPKQPWIFHLFIEKTNFTFCLIKTLFEIALERKKSKSKNQTTPTKTLLWTTSNINK